MALVDMLHQRSQHLRQLQHDAQLCASLAQAHISNGQRWAGERLLHRLLLRTEYQRARGRMLRHSGIELAKVHGLRLVTLNPQLIQVTQQLRQVRQCCHRCPAVNRNRLAGGRPFICLLNTDDQSVAEPMRFRLNEQGQIIEHN